MPRISRSFASLAVVGCAAALAPATSQAQYKVVGPDGKVTYTDRAPTASEGRVSSLSTRPAPGVLEVALPLELRQPATRFPVTLYVSGAACAPCDAGRLLLRQRGVPFNERQVQTPEDNDALERLSGGRDAPTLAIGAQILRGFAPEVWSSYLDAAGYPQESRLPPNYQYPPPAPITARVAPQPAGAAPIAAPTAPVPAAPPASGIRF